MDIKPSNMMFNYDTKDEYKIKHIDYGLMRYYGKEIGRSGTPGYMHPQIYDTTERGYASDKLDVYAVMISIAKLEFGYEYASFPNDSDCVKVMMTSKCLEDLRLKIFFGHMRRYPPKKFKNQTDYNKYVDEEYGKIKELAFDKSKSCKSLTCLIFREMRMKYEETEDIEAVYVQMKKLYKKLRRRIILL